AGLMRGEKKWSAAVLTKSPRLSSTLLAHPGDASFVLLLRLMANRLDLVAVGITQERAVVCGVIVARRPEGPTSSQDHQGGRIVMAVRVEGIQVPLAGHSNLRCKTNAVVTTRSLLSSTIATPTQSCN